MYKNKDYSLWSMVIFWPVSGTAYFPVLKSFPFIRKGIKPPPDFALKKEAAPSVSMGILMAMFPFSEGPTPPRTCHRASKTQPCFPHLRVSF